jgi:SMC interacting uncharacterized protein involved in chromosome segregation
MMEPRVLHQQIDKELSRMRITCLDFRKLPLLLVATTLLVGCQSAYYGAMEKFGYEKRDILVNRVEDVREAQQEAKKQFESALAQFIAVTNFSGGELEQQYNKLKGEFDDSESRANTVRKRIADVERVATDLFKEWEKEITQYTSSELRRSSQGQLDTTRARYRELIGAMKRAEKKLDPVLAAFRDRVLFLKHNLNARAIASLKSERAKVQSDITALVADMNRSIAEADRFIKDMSDGKN